MNGTDFVWPVLAIAAVPVGYFSWELLRATVNLVWQSIIPKRGKQS